jgi:glycogen synthase kinase 3 beta
MWAMGCTLAEMALGHHLFAGDNTNEVLVEIFKTLGTPPFQTLGKMNPSFSNFRFPGVRPHPWNKVFRPNTPI